MEEHLEEVPEELELQKTLSSKESGDMSRFVAELVKVHIIDPK